jgi:hypothetical protein
LPTWYIRVLPIKSTGYKCRAHIYIYIYIYIYIHTYICVHTYSWRQRQPTLKTKLIIRLEVTETYMHAYIHTYALRKPVLHSVDTHSRTITSKSSHNQSVCMHTNTRNSLKLFIPANNQHNKRVCMHVHTRIYTHTSIKSSSKANYHIPKETYARAYTHFYTQAYTSPSRKLSYGQNEINTKKNPFRFRCICMCAYRQMFFFRPKTFGFCFPQTLYLYIHVSIHTS